MARAAPNGILRSVKSTTSHPLFRRLPATVVLALVLLLAACGSDDAPTFESTFGGEDTADDTSEGSPDSAPNSDAGSAETPAANEEGADPQADEPAPAEANEPEPPAELAPVTVPEGLSLTLTPVVQLDRPIDLVSRTGSPNVYIATKGGQVVEVDPTTGDIVREFINVSDIIDDAFESGLLGIEFSPDGQRFYMHYSDRNHDNTVVEVQMDGDELATESGRTLLVVEQPKDNHNGGDLAFGPDGYLYITLGDGGGSGDPLETGQDPTSLLGSILRIDPDGEPYAIPSDNPFAERGGLPEIFLYGVRNPWRISFDAATGDLWIADVGQDKFEEIDVLYASDGGGRGANLGWNLLEGDAPFAGSEPPASGYVGPIHTYGRDQGCSITGGHVYRGSAIPELQGIYIFGDYCQANIWGVVSSEAEGFIAEYDPNLWAESDGLTSFGEGPDGEIYVLTFPAQVYRIDPAG